jgi:APA family basic amino acid/polyamine antiporter
MTHYNRAISLFELTLYGIGTILGAGIYVLVGEVTNVAGMYVPIAFLFAAATASFTGMSYAELSSRLPRSGGEALYVRSAFNSINIGNIVGWMVIATGAVSTATMATGIVGYAQYFFPHLHSIVITLLFVLFITAIAVKGIQESVTFAAIVTLVETSGLLFVIFMGADKLDSLSAFTDHLLPKIRWANIDGIAGGAFLAFYAFIGFEDMVNVADEVKKPQKTMPIAIISAILFTSVMYILVSLVLIRSLGLAELSQSKAPLALFFERYTNISPSYISIIGLFAVINGGLIQIIMGSRILQSLSAQGGAPMLFAELNPRTQTPIFATLLLSVVILALAYFFPLGILARITSLIILTIFTLVNLSLIIIKQRNLPDPQVSFHVIIPIIGFFTCVGLLASRLVHTFYS